MAELYEDFAGELNPRWNRHLKGTGALELSSPTLRFVNVDTSVSEYTNAQIDDYQGLRRAHFPWRSPLRLSVRARFSHPTGELRGTGGFGFWNDPFLMTEKRVPTLPRALWFFYGSPPSDMKLDTAAPGAGWKAATIDALRPIAVPLAPLALPAAVLMNVRSLYRALWPPIQRALNVREMQLGVSMIDWHTYTLLWGRESSTFSVDGEVILDHAPSPRGPLGFVMWLDNQYMIVKPWGRFGWGLLEAPGRQWLEVDRLSIELVRV